MSRTYLRKGIQVSNQKQFTTRITVLENIAKGLVRYKGKEYSTNITPSYIRDLVLGDYTNCRRVDSHRLWERHSIKFAPSVEAVWLEGRTANWYWKPENRQNVISLSEKLDEMLSKGYFIKSMFKKDKSAIYYIPKEVAANYFYELEGVLPSYFQYRNGSEGLGVYIPLVYIEYFANTGFVSGRGYVDKANQMRFNVTSKAKDEWVESVFEGVASAKLAQYERYNQTVNRPHTLRERREYRLKKELAYLESQDVMDMYPDSYQNAYEREYFEEGVLEIKNIEALSLKRRKAKNGFAAKLKKQGRKRYPWSW